MTLVPDFDIGLWNAWIIMVAFLAASFLPFFVWSENADARMEGDPGFKASGPGARLAFVVTHLVLMPFTLVYSFFVPLERGTWWLYSGLIVSGAAILMALWTSVLFATAPVDRPITHGVYAVSRHPMYVAGVGAYAGIGLAGTSWVFLACAAAEMAAWAVAVPEEERNLVAKYGVAYTEYVQRTPRWLGLPRRR
jgi:protein-S-isoprenylcysteine O-methyltransferase Ste14